MWRTIMGLWIGVAIAAAAGPPAKAQMNVTDDPYKSYAEAEFKGPLKSAARQSYCGDGASYSVYGVVPRSSAKMAVGMRIEVDGLRSPGEIVSVDLLGGLALTKSGERMSSPNCYGASCHNDVLQQFSVPDETIEAVKAQGRVPLRVTTTMGDNCLLSGAITADEVRQLEEWAASRQPKVTN